MNLTRKDNDENNIRFINNYNCSCVCLFTIFKFEGVTMKDNKWEEDKAAIIRALINMGLSADDSIMIFNRAKTKNKGYRGTI